MNLIDPTIIHDKTCILYWTCKGECTCDYEKRQRDAQAKMNMLIPMDEFHTLKADNKELESLFAMQKRRVIEATKYWQEKTGRKDTWPDLGALLMFLMDEVAEVKGLRDALEEIDSIMPPINESDQIYISGELWHKINSIARTALKGGVR
jgi:hypothetical protein